MSRAVVGIGGILVIGEKSRILSQMSVEWMERTCFMFMSAASRICGQR